MKKQLLLLACMGTLALGAGAQTVKSGHTLLGPPVTTVGPTAEHKHLVPDAKAADLTKKVGATAITRVGATAIKQVGPTAPKVPPIARK